MIALTFTIHLHEPLLVAQLEGDPNSAVSYPYVPGSVIRGALANRYLSHLDPPDPDFDLAVDDEGHRLFFDGTTRFLNAYPLDRLGQRSLPVPRSWYYDKLIPIRDRESITDAIAYLAEDTQRQDVNDNERHPPVTNTMAILPDNIEWKRVNDDERRSFCRVERREGDLETGDLPTAHVEFVPVARHVAIHTQRERRKGRATRAEGAVFRYESLAAGQRFGGVILVDVKDETKTSDKRARLEDKLVQEFEKLLLGDFWLGKSRSAGYGRVSILDVKRDESWQEMGTPSIRKDEPLVITLLSDLVTRTLEGAPADDLTSTLLPAPLNEAVEHVASFKRVRLVGGFNRRWGLPTCQEHVLAAGSVFVFRATRDLDAADLQSLTESGIGERRVDGLGHIAINWHIGDAPLVVREVLPEASSAAPPTISPAHENLAARMVERLLRRDLDRRLAEYIHQRHLEIPDSLTNAQLSRLRAIVLDTLAERTTKRLVDFLSDAKLKARARGQYESARIDRQSAREWLLEHLQRPGELWQWLKFEPKRDQPGDYEGLPQIGQVRAQLTPALANEYTIRLIEGVLHRIVQERKERERQREVGYAAR